MKFARMTDLRTIEINWLLRDSLVILNEVQTFQLKHETRHPLRLEQIRF